MTKTLAFILATALAACAGTADVQYSGNADRPELVALDGSPDVEVVANADEPTFYSDHTFWLYRDHTWYRSSSHVRGWARAGDAPEAITRIERPEHYVHYGRGGGPRATYNEHTPPPAAPPPPAQPVIRDHRESPDAPMPPDRIQAPAPGQTPGMPAPAPGMPAPTPPPANPLPPTQVPPAVP